MLTKPRDPDAHVIHAPGPRLLRGAPLRHLKQPRIRRRRAILVTLGMVGLIDVLVVIVVFLIVQPQLASGECCIRKNVRTPWALDVEDMLDTPVITVSRDTILVDGVKAGFTREIAESGQVQTVEDLRQLLAAKRELWRQVVPDKPFPGTAVLEIDEEVPSVVVKSVFESATKAGYPHVSFMVKKLEVPIE